MEKLLTFALLLTIVTAGTSFRTESIENKPVLNHWIKHVPAEDHMLHSFSLQLHAPGLEELRRQFHEEIYNTAHPNHRQYLSDEQIKSILAVPEDTRSALVDALKQADAQAEVTIGPHGDYIHVNDMKVSEINRFFNIQLHHYRDDIKNKKIFRTEDVPTLPKCVKTLHRVFGDFFPHARRSMESFEGEPGINITPSVIRQQYNIDSTKAKSGRTSGQAFAAFEDAEFQQEWLKDFCTKYGEDETKIKVVGDNTGGYYGEATLDSQYITTIGADVDTMFVYLDYFDMLAWVQLVEKQKNAPKVLSISWGSGEDGYQPDHMTSANDEFMKMGAKGFSIFVASGDKGTGNTGLLWCKKFSVEWPATSPYVTAVGGTYVTSATAAPDGWNYSGGGFSTAFKTPSYQSDAVSGYVNNSSVTLPDTKYWTKGGRGLPDVSALATNFETYMGAWGVLSGTSAAAPTFAGMISLINDKRAANGKAELGFLNQDLYNIKSWTDVTTGDNTCSPCKEGFKAASGWDPVTGLGVPDYASLEKALADL